ncbi:hypothetical protein D3C72_1710660 [compost metagenome]
MALGVRIEQRVPGTLQRLAVGLGVPDVVDRGRHFERGVGPAQRLARSQHFGAAQRGAVHVVAAFLVRGALADLGAAADQGRLVAGLGLRDGHVDGGHVMAVDAADHVPAVGFETLRGIVVEPVHDVAVDRDAVVVPQRN